MTCTSCSRTVPEGSRFCPHCAAPADAASFDPTRTSASHPGYGSPAAAGGVSSSDPSDHGRFLPGTMLGGRYRVVGLLGRGGMGEVYRADDLKLGQAVALKFLPASVERDQGRLQRFLNEVKIARQISHPNVCRVYDVGEVDGHHYLSMEYVDGEDLASLLRRIGRLPKDKAVQISRQLCVGLAAAHEQGILHRDLKPANVMIDGRGRAKITDFGLATLAGTTRADEVGAGTPLYMAPEQRAGKDVTIRSDLYSLGLVLYELFTGQPAFKASTPAELARLQEESTPTSPSRHVEDLDPMVERAILRCLEKEPRDRPASALAVAASLPGGDPLAAALAAGETPSPEMVAAAGDAGGLRPFAAIACLVGIVLGLGLRIAVLPSTSVLTRIDLERSPDVMAAEAQAMLADLGYSDRPADRGYNYQNRVSDYIDWVKENDKSPRRWDNLGTVRPSPIIFWYRQSPGLLEPVLSGWLLGLDDPPRCAPGAAVVVLDPAGRLLQLEVGVPEVDPQAGAPSRDPDGSRLLAHAGFDASLLRPSPPAWNPTVSCDQRLAWEGVYPNQPNVAIRVEAGFHRGRPVWFRVVPPWVKGQEIVTVSGVAAEQLFVLGISFLVFASGLILAWRNLRLGRGDRKGAARVAFVIGSGALLGGVLSGHHVAAVSEIRKFGDELAWSLLRGGLAYVLYLALEPYVRRLWPEVLVSWSRLLAGRLRDPLVGRDFLIGGLAFASLFAAEWLGWVADRWTVATPAGVLTGWSIASYKNATAVLGALANTAASGIVFIAIGALLGALVLRVVLRKQWAVMAGFVALGAVYGSLVQPEAPVPGAFEWAMLYGIVAFVLLRFGLLAMYWMFGVWSIAGIVLPALLPWSSWHACAGVMGLSVIFAVTGYAFWISLAGRPIFRGSILPE